MKLLYYFERSQCWFQTSSYLKERRNKAFMSLKVCMDPIRTLSNLESVNLVWRREEFNLISRKHLLPVFQCVSGPWSSTKRTSRTSMFTLMATKQKQDKKSGRGEEEDIDVYEQKESCAHFRKGKEDDEECWLFNRFGSNGETFHLPIKCLLVSPSVFLSWLHKENIPFNMWWTIMWHHEISWNLLSMLLR